jgi:prepilin-type N-terminal cleavage/methylation domain-containing protein
MKSFFRKFRYGEKGFTLIELLVVIAILGVLAAVAVPNVGKFMGRGKTEARAAELHNIQTAVIAMLADSTLALIDVDGTPPVTDTAAVGAWKTNDATPKVLSNYLTGLEGNNAKVAADQSYGYSVTADGTVTMIYP